MVGRPGRQPEEKRRLRDFGIYFNALRKDEGLTLQQLADRLGVTPQYLSKIQRGEFRPSEARLRELAAALHADPVEFLARAGVIAQETKDILTTRPQPYAALLRQVEARRGRAREQLAGKLESGGLPEQAVDAVLAQLPDAQVASIMRGEEPLEIRRSDEVSAAALAARRDAAFEISPPGEARRLPGASASDYLSAVAAEFGKGKQQRRVRQETTKTRIEAGPRARIEVSGAVTAEQRSLLESLAAVIAKALDEKGSKGR